ncbi:MAG: carboxypeptidase-like regulatory domain-containing protein, partial [Senegalimassilia anaerobia]
SEDGAVSGISFRITGAGVDRTVKTDGSGKVLVANLPSGRYTVAEQTGESYAPTEEQTVTVTAGQTAQVSFQNRLKQWRVTVTKVDGDTLYVRFSKSGQTKKLLKDYAPIVKIG